MTEGKKQYSREVVLRKLKERETFRKKGQTVLAQLHDVFEEGEGDEFLGDPMWWRYIEDIDCDRIYLTTGIEFRQLRLMFWEVVVHIVLLGFLTNYVLILRSPEAFRAQQEQLQFWRGCKTQTPVTAKDYRDKVFEKCDIDSVVDIPTFWEWLDLEFIPKAFTPVNDYEVGFAVAQTQFEENSFTLKRAPRLIGDEKRANNLLLGMIRLRQLRVQKNQGCQVSSLFSHIFTDCRALFNKAYQSTSSYMSPQAPTYTEPNYKYRLKENTGCIAMEGMFSSYPGDGFVMDIPLYQSESHILIHDLWNFAWLDSSTRAVIIEFSLLNVNSNVIMNNRMLFEFGPTGNVKIRHEVNTWPVWFLEFIVAGSTPFSIFFYTVVLCGMYLYLFYGIIWHMKQTGVKYFMYGWNYLDLLCFALFVSHIVFRIEAYLGVAGEVNLSPERVGHPDLFMPFSRAVYHPLRQVKLVLSFLVLVTWLKTLKYLCLWQGFRTLVRVMMSSLGKLVVFSFVVLVIFFAFAIAFYLGFGSADERFTTVWGTFLILFFYLVGGFELNLANWFTPMSDTIRPLIFLAYLLLTYFILVNVFMAIVLDAYTMTVVIRKTTSTLPRKAKHEKKKKDDEDGGEGSDRNALVTFLYTYYHYLRGIDLIGEDEKNDDDADYEFIDLEDLPGVIAKKWLMKKRKMIETVARISGDNMDDVEQMEKAAQEKPQQDDMDEEEEEEFYDEEGNLVVQCRQQQEQMEEVPSFTSTLSKSIGRMKSRFFNSIMPESQKALQNIKHIPMTTKAQLTTKGLYNDDPKALEGALGRPQLQRLLDEDKALRILLGTGDALQIIKRFKYLPDADAAEEALARELEMEDEDDEDDFDSLRNRKWEGGESQAITSLQEVVFSRLDKLEKSNLNVDSVEVPQIRFLSNQLADLLSDVQNCWREGIISVLEAATLISASLLQFTKGIEDVSVNHNVIMEAMCIEDESSPTESDANASNSS